MRTSACRQEVNSDAEWIETNLGPFSQYTPYSDLKVFNLSQVSRVVHNQSSLRKAAQHSETDRSTNGWFCRVKQRTKFIHALGLYSQETVVGVLSPQQKAELILDPDSGALEDPTLVTLVFTNFTQSGDDQQITQFFQTFTEINNQVNASH